MAYRSNMEIAEAALAFERAAAELDIARCRLDDPRFKAAYNEVCESISDIRNAAKKLKLFIDKI